MKSLTRYPKINWDFKILSRHVDLATIKKFPNKKNGWAKLMLNPYFPQKKITYFQLDLIPSAIIFSIVANSSNHIDCHVG